MVNSNQAGCTYDPRAPFHLQPALSIDAHGKLGLIGPAHGTDGPTHLSQSATRIAAGYMDIPSDDDASVLLSSTLTPTNGFHTTSTTRVALRGSRPRSCTLHLYFALPAQLFADPYELAHRHAYYTFERFGGGNLEAPVFAPGAGGPSGLLLDLIVPENVDGDGDQARRDGSTVEVEVPLHARYGIPKAGRELVDEVMLPPPEAFWVCPQQRARGSGAKRAEVPDALQNIVELPAFQGGDSTLVLIPRSESAHAQTLRVPVGDVGDVALVETGTVIVILLAFVYLLRTIALKSRARAAVGVVGSKKSN